MPPRKSVKQKEIENLTRKHLDKLGRTISVMAARTSRVRTGDLRDSENYRTKPYNVLTVSQNFYGKYNYPKGKTSGQKNALRIAIDKYTPEGIEVFVKDMKDLIMSPVVLNKK